MENKCRVIEASVREAEMYLYDVLGEDLWGGGGMTATRFKDQLAELGEIDRITLYINSPGGDVFDGLAIYNMLMQHTARVTTVVMGQALSAASIVFQAGSKRQVAEGAFLMIHRAAAMTYGNATELTKLAGTLAAVDGQLAEIYARRSGATCEAMMAAMDEESWYTADQAVTAGLADKAIKSEQQVAGAVAAYGAPLIAAYRHTPPALRAAIEAARIGAMGETQGAENQAGGTPENEPDVMSDRMRAGRLRLLDLQHRSHEG